MPKLPTPNSLTFSNIPHVGSVAGSLASPFVEVFAPTVAEDCSFAVNSGFALYSPLKSVDIEEG